ncbi:hypothetical protein [Paenibacillus sp. HW567]|uniref:hypothetical protein n=1 Tax=Paenibacillus sp. HW567 TaxID=1034769 RepID=UPI00037B4D4A|nr:hypothetical protein [Paenibacillus sp. HW567]
MKRVMFTLVVAVMFLSGCSFAGNSSPSNSPAPVSVTVPDNLPYSVRIAMSIAISSTDNEKQLGKPAIVRSGKPYTYEIRNLPDQSRLITVYDQSLRLLDQWRLDKLLNKEVFDGLTPGLSTSADVEQLDRFIYLVEYPKGKALSEHRLVQGTVTVNYENKDNTWVVKDIEYGSPDSPANLSRILEPEDLKEILPDTAS